MANPEHVEIARQGAKAIRTWREENAEEVLDLRQADLGGTKLSEAGLTGAERAGTSLYAAVNVSIDCTIGR